MSKEQIKQFLETTKQELTDWYSKTGVAKEKNYAIEHAKWSSEKVIKNRMIRERQLDRTQRKRKNVYWGDLGMNVGSELCEKHFCVVIKEFEKTAVVVPLSSVKEGDEDSDWKKEEHGYFKIGSLEGLLEKKESYAVVSQIRSVSKKRLTTFKNSETQKPMNLKMTDAQMDIIDNGVKSMFTVR